MAFARSIVENALSGSPSLVHLVIGTKTLLEQLCDVVDETNSVDVRSPHPIDSGGTVSRHILARLN